MSKRPTIQALSDKLDEIRNLTVLAAKTVLDVQEAALLIGFSEGHLYRLTSNKAIPHYKKGGKLYFRKGELEEWLTENRISTDQEISRKAATHLATHRR